MSEEPVRRRPWVVALLVLVPLWLLISGAVGLWLNFRQKAAEARVEQLRFVTPVKAELLADDMGKLMSFVGERNASSGAGPQGLTRAVAMVEGALGPGNAGYAIEKVRGPETPSGSWPLLIVSIRGKDEKAAPVWVVTGLDSRGGSPGAEANASGIASTLAAANALAGLQPKRSIHFAFLPHAYDPESPVLAVLDLLRKRIGGTASVVLAVESTGKSPKLMLSTRDAENIAPKLLGELGTTVGAEAICLVDDFDLSSALFEVGLPAVRVATRDVVRPDEPDLELPDPQVHAEATRALVELIRRLANRE